MSVCRSIVQGIGQSLAPTLLMALTTLTFAAGPARASAGEESGLPALATALPQVVPASFSGDVRNLPRVADTARPQFQEHEMRLIKFAPAAVAMAPANVSLGQMPLPSHGFNGLGFSSSVTGGQASATWPPDADGDVGPNHFVEAVNSAYAIYNKTGGQLAAFTENALWNGSGSSPCNGSAAGQPRVVHDALADRWILSHIAYATRSGQPVSPFYQCIAVSKTSDPVAGGWWLYAIQIDTGAASQPPVGTENANPVFGIWTDCLYMSANGTSEPAGGFTGAIFASFSRTDLFAGNPLTMALGFIPQAVDPFTMVPSTLLGTGVGSLPPSGTPEYFVSESRVAFEYEVRKFTAGPNCGAGGTLGAPVNVSQTPYSVAVGNLVPQANTPRLLDSVGDRLMSKVPYRRIGSSESLWVVHTVLSGGTGSTVVPQWAQLDVSGGVVATAPVQQQIFAPDGFFHRWIPSLAVDRLGNMAMGYSMSSNSTFPGLAASGRLVEDPSNNLPRTERVLVAFGGPQTNVIAVGGQMVPNSRWGASSAMSVDPTDDCTFWYVNEYYGNEFQGSTGDWYTFINSFNFPGCGDATAPVVTTTSASGVSASTVTLNGTANPEGLTTLNAFFQWGVTAAYNTITASSNVGMGTSPVPYSQSLATVQGQPLSCGTTYHFQAVATNSGGIGYGGDLSFTTNSCTAPPPTVTTQSPSSVSATSAGLGGTVNPNGEFTTMYFQWGATTSYGNSTTSFPAGSGASVMPYADALYGLCCGTTYHYRAAATNGSGNGFGGDQSFTTASCTPLAPQVVTGPASGVTSTASTLTGTANPNCAAISASFQWGPTVSYGNTTPSQPLGAGAAEASFTQMLSGLSCETTYHFRAVATNGSATMFGDDMSFATGPCPATSFYTVTPCRVLDTRPNALAGNTPQEVSIANVCGIPATAIAVSANITAVQPSTDGFLTLWPAQTALPATSNLNLRAGQVRANNAILKLAPGAGGSQGAVDVVFGGAGTVNVLIDVNGYFQ